MKYLILRRGKRAKTTSASRSWLNYLEQVFILAAKERELRRFIQFCLVGASGYGIQFAVYWSLTRYAGLVDLIAHIPSIEVSVLSNFILHDIWTFKDRKIGSVKATLIRCLKFHLVSLGYTAFFYGGYTPLTRYLGWYDLPAWIVAAIIGLAWNFSINLLWTWREKETCPSCS
jgi:putative flippase GtrA